MNEALIQYIKKNVDLGHDIEKIKKALINAGHDIKVVEEHATQVIGLGKKENKFKFTNSYLVVFLFVILIVTICYFAIPYIFSEKRLVSEISKEKVILKRFLRPCF